MTGTGELSKRLDMIVITATIFLPSPLLLNPLVPTFLLPINSVLPHLPPPRMNMRVTKESVLVAMLLVLFPLITIPWAPILILPNT